MNITVPQYSLSEFQDLIRANGVFFFNKKRVLNFQAKYEWTDEQIIDFLLKLQPNDFKKHFPSNKVNDLAGHVLICADQYVVKWCEHNNVKADRWNRGTVEISAKIAIATTPNGSIAGTVSFHSEW